MTESQERPLHELLSRSMVDIYVGPENTHWILHEKLLCSRSKFFQKIFYSLSSNSHQKSFGLPDEEDEPFRQFVGWLYSGAVPAPSSEADLTNLFDLYLMGEKWQISGLVRDALAAARAFYRRTDSFPGLRRVQYVYANTDADSPMRQLLVASVARMLVLREDGIPAHWDKALRKNGQLAVDVIKSMQEWKLGGQDIPDPREEPDEIEKEKVRVVEEHEKNMTDQEVQERMPAGLKEELTNGVGASEGDDE